MIQKPSKTIGIHGFGRSLWSPWCSTTWRAVPGCALQDLGHCGRRCGHVPRPTARGTIGWMFYGVLWGDLVGVLVAIFWIFPEILGNVIIPIDELIFFRGVVKKTPTRDLDHYRIAKSLVFFVGWTLEKDPKFSGNRQLGPWKKENEITGKKIY